MEKECVTLIGLAKFKPSQQKYKDGHVYISVLISGDDLVALDVRFFSEDGDELVPTRNGFRVPVEALLTCVRELLGNPPDLDATCHKTKTRELHVRYVSDKYGEAIDIRYYKKSAKYTGWEKRGLRLRVADFKQFQKLIGEINFVGLNAATVNNLLEGKTIVDPKERWAKGTVGVSRKTKKVGEMHPPIQKSDYINEALRELIS